MGESKANPLKSRTLMAGDPISVFISYARKDEALMQELDRHLAPLKRKQWISSWHDGCIMPGEEWEPQIKANLEQAQIILLLISVDFICSDYCYEVELAKAIERHCSGKAQVIPVILRDCDWHGTPVGEELLLGDLQALPKDAKPISRWESRDDAFADTARGIRKAIQDTQLKRYEQVFEQAISESYPLSPAVMAKLKTLRQQLGLRAAEVVSVEEPIRDAAEAAYQQHLQAVAATEQQRKAAEAKRQKQQEAERQRQAAEAQRQREAAQRQREEAARQQKQRDYFSGGLYHLEQGNFQKAIADLTQAERYGHSDARRMLAEAERQKQAAEDRLDSEKGINYQRLRDLLKAGDWKAADQETTHRMLEAVGRGKKDWIRKDELLNFPCTDLLTIDRLWVKYSQGKWGFTVQKRIYVECGAQLDGNYPGDKIWRKFCDRVGWRKNGVVSYSQLTFDPQKSPAGEFPRYVGNGVGLRNFFSRIETCKL